MSIYSQHYDLAVIGGGITGAGVALDAVKRGLSVALFEQYDFGIGASTATSKLAHGGLRYLEQFKFKLVKESLNERNYLLRSASHIVKPLRFYVPIYNDMKWKPWQLSIGLKVYDLLQTDRALPKHEMLGVNRLKKDIPWLNSDNLIGCGSYYDAQMEDHRLIIESLLMASHEGAKINNYSKVTNLSQTSIGASFDVNSKDGTASTQSASTIMVATGAWNNQFSQKALVKPTKGIHIVLPDMDLSAAILLMTPQTNRVFFVMPWQGKTLVGTTDSLDDNRYSSPIVYQEEAQYLLDALNSYSIGRAWEINDIESVFCGYRPLISTDESSPSEQTREERYHWVDEGVLSISGGKYTTYRQMAKNGVDTLVSTHFKDRKTLKKPPVESQFIGNLNQDEWPSETQLNQLNQRYHLQRESILHLIDTYGNLYI